MECLSQQKIISTRVSAPAQSPQDDSLFQGSESVKEKYSMSHIETEVAIVCDIWENLSSYFRYLMLILWEI